MEAAQIHRLIGSGFSPDATSSHAPAGTWYTDETLADTEQQRVFGRAWNYVCHHSELAEPGPIGSLTSPAIRCMSSVVADGSEGWSEQFVHHFTTLTLEALTSE